MRRLIDSARIYRMDSQFTQAGLTEAVLETIRANEYKACYIRPLLYRGYHTLGVNPFPCPVDAAVLTWEWGAYLGKDAVEQGVDVRVASWARSAPNTFPTLAKTSANYANSQLIKMEAVAEGYSEGIALDTFGYLSEGSGQNLFLVRDGLIYTPPLSAAVLPGITRNSVLTLARDLGFTIREEMLPREMLYIADEAFFVGTAVEITPIRTVDKIAVGTGRRGPITEALQTAFFDVINGEAPDRHDWLTYVYPGEPLQATVSGTSPVTRSAGV
jgi:branched-chain amino acid aminotransferase